MTRAEERDETFDLLRDLPVEVSMEEVGTLVAAIALAPSAAGWLSSLNINLNTMIITGGAGASIIAGSIYLMSPGGNGKHAENTITNPLPATEVMAEPEPEPTAAVPLTMPETQEVERTTPAHIEPVRAVDLTPAPVQPVEPLDPFPILAKAGPMVPETPVAPYSKDFDLTGFTRVVVDGAMKVHISQGDFSVRVSGDEALADKLELRVEGKVLTIGGPRGNYACNTTNNLGVEVQMPALEQAVLNGSGDVTMADFNTTGEMELALNGSGNMRFAAFKGATALNVEVSGSGDITGMEAEVSGKTRIEVAGSGDVRVSGKTDVLLVVVEGSGDVTLGELQAREGDVRVHGSGDVRVNCSGTLHTNVVGSGEVTNSGNARETGSDAEDDGSN